MNNKTRKMTEGSPLGHILRFCLPLIGGLLFQQLYSLVDSAIVGRLLGADALGAVGATGSITFLVFGISTGICSGFSIPVSQYFGAGDKETMKKCIGTSIWICVILAAVVTTVTVLLCMPILKWMKTPDDLIGMAYAYMVVIFAGIPATILYNLIAGYLRALGNSKVPMIFVIIASVLNIGLDILFIMAFHTGTAGAALATVIAQLVSGLGALIYVFAAFEPLHVNRAQMRFSGKCAKELLTSGVPMGLQFSITAVGCMILQVFINQLGTAAVSAISAGSRLCNLLGSTFDALGSTAATYCGQNVGAGKIKRLWPGILTADAIGAVYSTAVFVLVLFFGRQCSMLFLDPSETELLNLSARYLVVTTAFYIPLTLVNVHRLSIQGMGYSAAAIAAGVMELLGRGLVGMILVPRLGYIGACLGQPMAWIAADLFLVPGTFWAVKRLKRNYEQFS